MILLNSAAESSDNNVNSKSEGQLDAGGLGLGQIGAIWVRLSRMALN